MAGDGANVGSRARDHLANERTFLAWVRTGLGGLALGIAVERFQPTDSGNGTSVLLAVLLIGLSVVLLAGATYRYFSVASDLDRGRFRVDRRGPVAVVVGAAVVVVVTILAVI